MYKGRSLENRASNSGGSRSSNSRSWRRSSDFGFGSSGNSRESSLEDSVKPVTGSRRDVLNENQLDTECKLRFESGKQHLLWAGRKTDDAKATLSRCQTVTFPSPEAVSTEEGECSHLNFLRQYFILKDVLTKHRGKLSAELVDVTLDPETAAPCLIVSEDRKSVRLGVTRQNLPDTPQRFDTYPFVLGCESFTAGRHYWEVEVGDKTLWVLGVCKDSVSRKGKITASSGNGYWACTSPITERTLSVRPQAVGIFLDYEAGKVSFYNADNKSHLCTFTHTFTGTLRPFFGPCTNTRDLRIRPVPDWE